MLSCISTHFASDSWKSREIGQPETPQEDFTPRMLCSIPVISCSITTHILATILEQLGTTGVTVFSPVASDLRKSWKICQPETPKVDFTP